MIIEFIKSPNAKIKVGTQKKVPPAIGNKLVIDGYAKIVSQADTASEVMTKDA